ncbi:type IV secretory system conjugative DNA transfer family protein [Bacillus cereus]|nr:type IV secretory system conjugative DNA transfer family protein [Bacillus cereus]MEB9891850.1 type IV secretory system conjugative DNA transfer family protein [Bacillus cereus]
MNNSKLKITFGAITLSLLVMIVVEWLLATFFVWMPKAKEITSFDVVWEDMQDPIPLFQNALQVDPFIKMQLAVAFIFIYFVVRFYKILNGKGTYKDASSYGSEGTVRESKSSEVFDNVNFVKKTFNKKNSFKNLENHEGLIFGLLDDKPVILHEKTDIPNRNVFVVGSPGSGKTQSYILTNIIFERNRSIVVTDPKGEIYESTAKYKMQQGYEVRLINFKEMTISDRYNPIDYINKEIEAEQVATTIVYSSLQGQKPDFWTKAEVALLKTLLLYVKYECPNEANLAKAKEILTEHGRTPELMDEFFGRLEPDHPAYSAYTIVRLAEDKTRASIFITLAITLSKFDAKDARRFTETSDFLLDDIGKKKMIVYVVLPVADSTWEPLTANFFTQMFQRLYDVADRNFNKLPVFVNLLLDEFPNLGKIQGYEETLATCRSYGISCSTIIQSIGQLIDKYNKEKAEAIIGNCSLRILLGVGDKLTANYFSELIGKTTIEIQQTSISKNEKGGSDSKSNNYKGRSLFTPDELQRLPRNEAILLVSGRYPIRLKKAYQFTFFKGILNEGNKTSRFDYLKLKSEFENNDATEVAEDLFLTKKEDKLEKKEIIIEKESMTIEEMMMEEVQEKPHDNEIGPENEQNLTAAIFFSGIDEIDKNLSQLENPVKEIDLEMEHLNNNYEELQKDETELVVAEGPEMEQEETTEFDLPMGEETELVIAEGPEMEQEETTEFDLPMGEETELVVAEGPEMEQEETTEFDLPMGEETELVIAEGLEVTEGFNLDDSNFDSLIAELQDSIIENESTLEDVQQEKSESYELTIER